jgi:GNAT superfamily N-acetyltransferase
MQIEQCHYLDLTDVQRAELHVLWSRAFPAEERSVGAPEHFAEPQMLFRVTIGSQVATVVSVSIRTIIVGNSKVTVGAIGGVATDAQHRGIGLATSAMNAAHAYLEQVGVAFGLLQCHLNRVTFYEALGWKQVLVPMYYSQPDGSRHLNSEHPMTLTLGTATWPDGEIDVNGLPF